MTHTTKDFFERHSTSDLEIFDILELGIRTSTCTVHLPSSPQELISLRKIYQLRASNYLLRKSGSKILKQDFRSLSEALERATEMVLIWSFTFTDGRSVILFEGSSTRSILGFLRSVDARIVAHSEVDRLWAPSTSAT